MNGCPRLGNKRLCEQAQSTLLAQAIDGRVQEPQREVICPHRAGGRADEIHPDGVIGVGRQSRDPLDHESSAFHPSACADPRTGVTRSPTPLVVWSPHPDNGMDLIGRGWMQWTSGIRAVEINSETNWLQPRAEARVLAAAQRAP
jgi:hypothetical protein